MADAPMSRTCHLRVRRFAVVLPKTRWVHDGYRQLTAVERFPLKS